jgi:glucuronoarabinoxylan endo-1,4-beta-xylanase
MSVNKRFYTYLFFISALVWSPCYGDGVAPKPATMKWLVVPATTGPYSITMTAVTALDAGNDYPVQYYFECINHGEANSTWQSSPTYEATGLTPGTVYTFKAKARDSVGNETGWTANTLSATTDADTTPPVLRLDLNNTADNDGANTQTGFLPFIIADSGSEINGVVIDLSGNITSAKREDPRGSWVKYDSGGSIPGDPCYYSPLAGERIYRDFIYGIQPSGVTITLWGLGVNRDCNITIWAFDSQSTGDSNRVANWYSNGTYIFDTNFMGGSTNWPLYDNQPNGAQDLYKYAFKGRATTDYLGRIVLTSSRDPESPEGQNFAFVNALAVEPNILTTFVPTKYAHRPVPFDGAEDAPVDVIFSWRKGGLSETRDVYFGTDEAKVTDANRSIPLGVLVSQGQEPNTYDPYGSAGLLELNKTYYWRVDEVNAAPDYTIFKGEVWGFTTLPYFVVEDFDSYEDDYALRNVWKDYTTNGTGAEVSVETAIARNGNSMRYWYKNNLPPYYSQAYVDIADLGIDDPDWLGIGAKTLVLYFYGKPTNPIGEQMYVKLTDGDSPAKTATVMYGNMNDVRLKQWNKWSIALTEFTDVNLANVSKITIGFGDVSPGNAGTVYFEDITLDRAEVEVLPEVTGEVDVSTVYQELEGFGAAGGWHEFEILEMQQSERDKLYDTLFDELGLDIYRVRNSYGYDSGYLNNSAQIIAGGKARNPSLKIMISSWSPPPYLKSNGYLPNGTLKKDPNGNYMYDAFAQWWADSLAFWDSCGVHADYVNIQNETDFVTDQWVTCRFDPTENSTWAGYRQAFEAVYQKLYSQMGPNMPKMLAPETAGLYSLDTYINNLADRSHVYGYAHHLYNGGGAYNYPDGFINYMYYYATYYSDKPLMMTEFAKGIDGSDVTIFPEAINLAHLMHNALVFENASAYVYWELFWTPPNGLVSYVGTPSSGTSYAINPVYYAFKHYSAFTDPGWHRVEASTSLGPQGNLRISAFKSPDNQQLSIVIINLAYNNINLTLNLNGFPLDNSEIYRTSETENTAYIGPFYEAGSLMLPARSITTISNVFLSNCDSVLAAEHGLTSDIYPDCYVDLKDLSIVAHYWLNTDCAAQDDCEGADFEPENGVVDFSDLGTFVQQWLWCNNPKDTGCIHNW